MNRIIVFLIAVILIFHPSVFFADATFLHNLFTTKTMGTNCPIEPIIPMDDAFHGFDQGVSVEWWYFDAVFDNDYGIHVGVMVISYGSWGMVKERINLYHDSEIISKAYQTLPLSQFQISQLYPDIKKNDRSLISFNLETYQTDDIWEYRVTNTIDHLSVDLTFTGLTEGFKYVTSHEGWTIAQPRAKVTGAITNQGEVIQVSGRGYHDHNWNFTVSTAIRATGWYWGKITSENYTLTWAQIQKNQFIDTSFIETLGIVNILHDGYLYIQPENINITTTNMEYHDGRFIPTAFSFDICQDDIEVNVTFSTRSIQRAPPIFLTIHYWRFFVTVNGYIRVGENIDVLDDDVQIIECMRFI